MFENDWVQFFPLCKPIAWRVRDVYSDIWFRIHSLPESKRYAESEEEYQTILSRHNAMADAVLGEGSNGWLCWYGYKQAGRFSGIPVSDYTNDDWGDRTTIYGVPIVWKIGDFDSFIKQVADDQLSSSIFMNSQSGDIYAPYDGGADIFIHNPEKRRQLYKKSTTWLSPHTHGL